MKIDNLKKLQVELQNSSEQHGSSPEVVVGYTAAYALYVHENMEMKLAGLPRKPPHKGSYWDPQGQAGPKFLEAPARELATEITGIVKKALTQGRTLAQGLLLAGLRLQRESMSRVPVDTGNLKNSAFTKIEHD